MSRPKFLNCVMPSNVIRSIRESQREYDKDPEAYERREQENKERMREEEEREYMERGMIEQQCREREQMQE